MTRILSIVVFLFAGLAFGQQNPLDYVMTRTIQFDRPQHPYFSSNYPADRVRLDLSLDGGSTWSRNIAYGLPARHGTNSFAWSFRVTPEMWTERARVAVRTLWSSTTNAIVDYEGWMSDTNFAICGVRILSPAAGATVLKPGYQLIRWHEAGPDFVTIGTSSDGLTFTPAAVVESKAATNSYYLPIVNLPAGPLWICIHAYTNLYDIVQVQVVEQ